MEAARFGFHPDTPPAFKFDPTDADIVAFYLLPRALNLPSPFAHAVIDDDPASLPPRALLEKHNHGSSHHAFFFGPPTDMAKNSGRKERTIKDGGGAYWRGQKGVFGTLTLLHPGGGEVNVEYKRYDLTYKQSPKEKKTTPTRWVMHEYQIISPPLPGTVLSRIKVAGGKRREEQQQHAEAKPLLAAVAVDQYQHVLPAPEDPGPSHQYNPALMQDVFQGPEQPGPSYHLAVPGPEQPGQGYQYHPAAVMAGGEGFGDAPYYGDDGGGMGEAGGYYIGDGVSGNIHYDPFFHGDLDLKYEHNDGL